MALSDIWKLKDYIKESFADVTKGKTKGADELYNQEAITAAIEAFRPLLGINIIGETLSTSGFLGEKLQEYSQTINKSSIPTSGKFILNLVLHIIAALPVLMQAGAISAEKTTFRPLRYVNRPQMADLRSYIEAARRGILDPNIAEKRMQELGFSDEDIKTLKELSFSVPSPSDIVSFAVREAYDEDIVKRFGQDDNIDTVLKNSKTHREQAGLSEELLRYIWRAHWDLPSTMQGFEMLQRGVIEDADLDLLLRAKDVMPFWREKLKAISYNPFTRVDVRRMHKLGILSNEEIVRAYQDVGYNLEKAQKMAQFTIEYNKDPEEMEQTNTDKLKLAELNKTRNNIIKSYEDNQISADGLKELLSSTGLNEEIIGLIQARVDYERDRDLLNDLVSAYRDLFVKGLATEEQVKDALQKIPVPTESINRLFEAWTIMKTARLDMPTKAEIVRWFKKTLIDEIQARKLLLQIGTQEVLLDLYIKDAVT